MRYLPERMDVVVVTGDAGREAGVNVGDSDGRRGMV